MQEEFSANLDRDSEIKGPTDNDDLDYTAETTRKKKITVADKRRAKATEDTSSKKGLIYSHYLL